MRSSVQLSLKHSPIVQGALWALLAAVLFGASAPLVQKAGAHIGSWMTAALLYAGAAVAGLFLRTTSAQEAALQKRHWPCLLLMALFGAVIGPVALAWGLQHTSGTSASLMLVLEAVFTVMLSYLFYREQIDRRVGLAILLLSSGGLLLVFDSAESGTPQVLGLLAVMGATLAWGIDNTLSRALADIDPGRVILGKAALGATCSLLIATAVGEATFPWLDGFGLFLIGATGYGLSLRFYLLAQRTFGAARTGSVFGMAPFIGALIAFGLGERIWSLWLVGGGILMIAGVILHMAEQHAHEHTHEAIKHEHAHSHDDGHHSHTHSPILVGLHSHWHQHEPMRHSHSHAPDLHHTHRH